MNILGKKLNTFSGDALSGISEFRRKRRRADKAEDAGQGENIRANETSRPRLEGRRERPAKSPRELLEDLRNGTGRGRESSNKSPTYSSSPLGGGFAFGGDTIQQYAGFASVPAAPIGFIIDPLNATTPTISDQQTWPPARDLDQSGRGRERVGQSAAGDGRPGGLVESSESLYDADAWSRLWFQRVMLLSLVRLLLLIRKVYEDYYATKTYRLTGQTGHFLISAATLFLPTVVFTIYRVARYLQITLPPLRLTRAIDQQLAMQRGPSTPHRSNVQQQHQQSPTKRVARGEQDSEEHQLTRALMSSPTSVDSGLSQQPAGSSPTAPTTTTTTTTSSPDDEPGLVTARQTPTIEEFHDSKSQQGSNVDLSKEANIKQTHLKPAPQQQAVVIGGQVSKGPKLESVNVDRLGDLPDKETTRVVIGASEQLLHGALFIFWQLKRQVDVLAYLVERACLWRKPHELEKVQLERMRTGSDGLEWFQDFYAAFLAILGQVYTLTWHWSSDKPIRAPLVSPSQLSAATSGLGSQPAGAGDSLSISHAAQSVSHLVGQQALAGKDLLIMSELVVSSAVVVSLLVAVRRRDDGPLTLALSMLGWGSLFSARIMVIALAFVHIGWRPMLPLVILHVLAIAGWIYKIAIDSHNGRPSERADEAKWADREAPAEVDDTQQIELDNAHQTQPEPQDATSAQIVTTQATSGSDANLDGPTTSTSNWSLMEHITLLAQILTLFAIPSLFYWPIMFNLKLNYRPFKYLVLILIQNFLLIPGIWFSLTQGPSNGVGAATGQLYLLGAVGGLSIVGFIFVSLYVACKPSLTEYFARADELLNEAEKSGIYFEFCSRVFKMPDLSKASFRRLMDQTERFVEEQYVEVEAEPNELDH